MMLIEVSSRQDPIDLKREVANLPGRAGDPGRFGTACCESSRPGVVLAGGGQDSCKIPWLTWVKTPLGSLKRALDGTSFACEASYAGCYPGEIAYCPNRRCELEDPRPVSPMSPYALFDGPSAF